MFITQTSHPLSPAQTTTLRDPLVSSLFDHGFHKLEIMVDFSGVSRPTLINRKLEAAQTLFFQSCRNELTKVDSAKSCFAWDKLVSAVELITSQN